MRNVTRRKKWSRDNLCQKLRCAGDDLRDAKMYAGLTGSKRYEKLLCLLHAQVQDLLVWALALPITPEEKLVAKTDKKRKGVIKWDITKTSGSN